MFPYFRILLLPLKNSVYIEYSVYQKNIAYNYKLDNP
jgi:hypothetical protein